MMMTTPLQTLTSSVESLRDELKSYDEEGLLIEALAASTPKFLHNLDRCWPAWAHRHQTPPVFAQGGKPWTTWLILGGRGAGKTRAGAEWVRGMALGRPGFS